MKHKPIPKSLREQVYRKYGGHCAYCGCELEYKDMQVDHATSIWEKHWTNIENDTDEPIQDDGIGNLMPSCRACNFYKGGLDIDGFRSALAELNLSMIMQLKYPIKMATKYGMIVHHNWDGKFYFEKRETK